MDCKQLPRGETLFSTRLAVKIGSGVVLDFLWIRFLAISNALQERGPTRLRSRPDQKLGPNCCIFLPFSYFYFYFQWFLYFWHRGYNWPVIRLFLSSANCCATRLCFRVWRICSTWSRKNHICSTGINFGVCLVTRSERSTYAKEGTSSWGESMGDYYILLYLY